LRVLVTGAGGMVGRAVVDCCTQRGDELRAYDHKTVDISDSDQVRETLIRDQPEAVINCAAWTDVDGCESNPTRAQAANAIGPENLAQASRQVGAVLVTISTDYVFDGEKEGFYTQRDDPNPKSVYGLSKLEGERRAQLASARTIVVRSGFIFGPHGQNFLSKVADRVRRGETVTAISDALGTPTYSLHLAARLRELAQRDLPGIYHTVNAGPGVTYEEFARAVFEELDQDQTLLASVTNEALRRPAPRPRNSRLKCLMSEAIGLSPLPFWRDALRDFVRAPG
jgi:dTDP-4-dehydrorhamnose reductase